MAYLVFTQKGEELQRIPLDKPITIGRSLDCDIWFDDRKLSRRHCRLEKIQNEWIVVDLGSHNGVTVRGEKVPRQVLVDGDVIEVGSFKITFHTDALVPRRPTMPVKEQRLPVEEELARLKAGGASRPLPKSHSTLPEEPEVDEAIPDEAPRPATTTQAKAASEKTSAVLPAIPPAKEKKPVTLAFQRPPAKPIVEGGDATPDSIWSTRTGQGILVAAGAATVALLALLLIWH